MITISTFWNGIQKLLFPILKECLGPLTEKQQQLVTILEMVRIEEFVLAPQRGFLGRPQIDRRAIARAFVAKTVYNCSTTKDFIEKLKNDSNLRQICGWELSGEVPSEATFSREFAAIATTDLPARVHEVLIKKYEAPRLVGHLSRDSTAIEAREKPARKKPVDKPLMPKQKRGRPRHGEVRQPKEPTRLEQQSSGMSLEAMLKDLPKICDVGTKKNSKGYKDSWTGYKLHVDWADGEIPVSCVLTSASVHDSQVAIPLSEMSAGRVTNLYDLMDAAYDAPQIEAQSRKLGHVPIIDQNPRRGKKIEMEPAVANRYNVRSTAERGNSMLKDNFGGRTVRVRGYAKVYAHLMFGILVLTAQQLIRLLQ